MRPWQLTATTVRASLLAAGGILALLAADSYATTGCTPPPCAADGTCRPNRREWGWYHTHWRPWPGEQVAPAPTPAGPSDAGEEEGGLPGIVLPDPAKETDTTAEKTEGPAALPAGDGMPPGAAEPTQPTPEMEIEPFGYLPDPAKPTARLTLPAAAGVAMTPPGPQGEDDPPPAFVMPLPTVLPADSSVAPAVNVSPVAAPNLHGDDAPPALPPSLLGAAPLRATQPIQRLAPVSTEPIVLGQPANLRPATSDVRPVSWQTPGGIALVNPAGAVAVEPGVEGAQHAIYYEVSDATSSAAAE